VATIIGYYCIGWSMDFRAVAIRVASWTYYHLTVNDLGDFTTLRPSVPDGVFDDDSGSEDFTTKRVCLAPSVEKAVLSLPYLEGEVFIYATDTTDVFYPNSSGCPELSDYQYKEGWSWGEYAELAGLDPDDEETHAEGVRGGVPDAESTGEVWSLKPIRVKRVGIVTGSGGKIESIKWF
jgi:hypothetical protein